jgi:NAD(P)-dependent dehydrogenase (short-subunit alcohol dehydrogenase family)
MSSENSSKSTTKIALVTGASRDLGRNTALSLAKRGVDVIQRIEVSGGMLL